MPRKGFWRELAQAAAEGTRDGVGAYVRSGGKASAGLSELLNRNTRQKHTDELRRRWRAGESVLRVTQQVQPPVFLQREFRSGTHGQQKLNVYTGYIYTKRPGRDGRLEDAKVHAVFDMQGQLQYVRDTDGNVRFGRSKGHTPPVDWDAIMPGR